MHCRTSYVHWYNHYKQVDPSRVVHNYRWVKSPFYPCNYIFHLNYHWFSKQFVYHPIINQVPLKPMRGWDPIVQVPKSLLNNNSSTFLIWKGWIPSHDIMFPTPYLISPQNSRHIETAKRVIHTHVN